MPEKPRYSIKDDKITKDGKELTVKQILAELNSCLKEIDKLKEELEINSAEYDCASEDMLHRVIHGHTGKYESTNEKYISIENDGVVITGNKSTVTMHLLMFLCAWAKGDLSIDNDCIPSLLRPYVDKIILDILDMSNFVHEFVESLLSESLEE